MQKDIKSAIADALSKYIKCHNEYAGEIVNFSYKISEAVKSVQKLPPNIQNELFLMILALLDEKGIFVIPSKF